MRVPVGVLFLVLGFLGTSADAYVRLRTPAGVPLEWRRGCPAFTITASGGAGLPSAELARLIEGARSAWQDGPGGCAQIPAEVIDADGAGGIEFDGASSILWRDADHCVRVGSVEDEVCLSPNAAAVTTVFFYERGDRAGEIVETDVEINGAFVFGLEGETDRVDFLATLTHELGHVLGLEHTCETVPGRAPAVDSAGVRVPLCFPLGALPEAVRAATMFPFLENGDLAARTPLVDERGAMCELYRDHAGVCADTGPGCGCDGGRDAPLAGLFAGVALVWWRRRDRRRAQNRAS